MSTVNHRVVDWNIRSQGLIGMWSFPISTARLKEKRSKKKETAATIILFLCLSKSALNTYKIGNAGGSIEIHLLGRRTRPSKVIDLGCSVLTA
jgi:hypothetical protein